MKAKNKVFIATSLDGYIADESGKIDWLHEIPNPDQNDMGYHQFMSEVDALVMGRTTFETVAGFDMDWPYTKPVFILSNSLNNTPKDYEGKVEVVNGDLSQVIADIHQKGFYNLYIDGGKTIQSFLSEDLIDELTLTMIPILLGGGTPLFNNLSKRLAFKCVETTLLIDQVAQSRYIRKR